MKRLVPLVLLALAACNQQQGGEPVQRINLDEIGPNAPKEAAAKPLPAPSPLAQAAADLCEDVTFEGTKLTHCVADPAKQSITTDLGPKGGKPYRSFAALRSSLGAGAKVAFAMNAGMYDGEGKPIGYFVEHGDRLKQLNRADGPGNFHMKPNGVFFGTGGKWQVMDSDRFYRTIGDRPAFGTQSGPMLVIDGKLHPEITENGPSRAIRNGVGVDAKGRAHFVISDEPVSFGRFARYFRDELKTPNALFLDGNVSGLWDPASGRMDARAPIGPMLVISDKE